MKSVKQTLVALAAFACLVPLSARAHHQGDPVGELIEQANELNSVVQNSWLRPNVKWAVNHFVGDIALIENCETDFSPVANHNGPQCRDEVQHVEMAWNRVANYLYDTNYDFPEVYQQYRQTEYAYQNAIAYMNH